MADQKLVEYIRSYLEQGYTEAEIRQTLSMQGMDLAVIDQAFSEAGRQPASGGGPSKGGADIVIAGIHVNLTLICMLGFVVAVIQTIVGVLALATGAEFSFFGGAAVAPGIAISLVYLLTGLASFGAFFLLLSGNKMGFLMALAIGAISIVIIIMTLQLVNPFLYIWIVIVGYLFLNKGQFEGPASPNRDA